MPNSLQESNEELEEQRERASEGRQQSIRLRRAAFIELYS